MFNVCRIPCLQCDTLSTPSFSAADSRKVLVMVHDWLYAIEVYDNDWTPIAPNEIEQRLRRVVQDAASRIQRSERAVPVGLLSADTRDRWAEVRVSIAMEESALMPSYVESPTHPFPLVNKP